MKTKLKYILFSMVLLIVLVPISISKYYDVKYACPTEQRTILFDPPIYPEMIDSHTEQTKFGLADRYTTTFFTTDSPTKIIEFYKNSIVKDTNWQITNESDSTLFLFEYERLPILSFNVYTEVVNNGTMVTVYLTYEPECLLG